MLDDKAFKMAAALSYYAAFSMGPLLIIVIAIAGFIFGEEAARGQLFYEMKNMIGSDGAQMLETIIKGAANTSTGIIATIISILFLVLGSAGVFLELQESLNIIWGVELKPGRGIWGFIKNRLVSFSMVVATGFLLMVSLIISSVITILNNYMDDKFPALIPVAFVLNNLASFTVITIMFALIYKVLPDVNISWRYVWLGAGITSFLFAIGKYLIGLYLGSSSYSSTYGAAASLVILFLWIYYSGLILFFGAELTQLYRKKYSDVKLTADSDGIIVPKVSELLKKAVEKEQHIQEKRSSQSYDRQRFDRQKTNNQNLNRQNSGKPRTDRNTEKISGEKLTGEKQNSENQQTGKQLQGKQNTEKQPGKKYYHKPRYKKTNTQKRENPKPVVQDTDTMKKQIVPKDRSGTNDGDTI
jgi:membrane protein